MDSKGSTKIIINDNIYKKNFIFTIKLPRSNLKSLTFIQTSATMTRKGGEKNGSNLQCQMIIFKMIFKIATILIALAVKKTVAEKEFVTTVSGQVQHGNFNYYGIENEGNILLELVSVTGDCDLYVSQHTLKPTYEPQSYCLQSATCGVDSVVIPKSFKRPIAIGIFGHPFYEVSTYHLILYEVDNSEVLFHYNPYNELSKLSNDLPNLNPDSSEKQGKKTEYIESIEESEYLSFFWVILTYILEFIISIIL